MTLSADAMFDFNKATLKGEDRSELDKLASDLRALDYSVITVVGHTDRIGSEAYNQKLSERRAQVVRDYLVENGRIPAAKINASGVDGRQPVTRKDQCTMTARAALIVCLAPDRRVDVEVVATK